MSQKFVCFLTINIPKSRTAGCKARQAVYFLNKHITEVNQYCSSGSLILCSREQNLPLQIECLLIKAFRRPKSETFQDKQMQVDLIFCSWN